MTAPLRPLSNPRDVSRVSRGMTLPTSFRISSFCGNGGCVAVAMMPDGTIAVRDDKIADGPVLTFSPIEWDAFIAGIKEGEFDRAVMSAAAGT